MVGLVKTGCMVGLLWCGQDDYDVSITNKIENQDSVREN